WPTAWPHWAGASRSDHSRDGGRRCPVDSPSGRSSRRRNSSAGSLRLDSAGLLVGHADGGVQLHELPVAVFSAKDGAPPRGQRASVREGQGEAVTAQPTVPSLNAWRSESVRTPPPAPGSPFFRNSTASAPSNHSSGSVPTSRVPLLARDVAV